MQKVGVIGSGKFGTTLALLLSKNTDVLMYTRRPHVCDNINNNHTHLGVALPENISSTTNISDIPTQCEVIFPVIPSSNFRETMVAFYPHLTPKHILIHGTKGLDTSFGEMDQGQVISPKDIHTMSAVILQETNVIRVGCLSGPNLAKEILDGQPTATVIASEFDEVI